MTKLEKMMNEYEDKVKIYDTNFEDNDLKGLCIKNYIFLENSLSNAEKYCILAKEIGHYETTVGNILDQSSVNARKQERQARMWASSKILPLKDLINALKMGIDNIYDLADELNITVEFLQETLSNWISKYGCIIYVEDCVLNLETLEIL